MHRKVDIQKIYKRNSLLRIHKICLLPPTCNNQRLGPFSICHPIALGNLAEQLANEGTAGHIVVKVGLILAIMLYLHNL